MLCLIAAVIAAAGLMAPPQGEGRPPAAAVPSIDIAALPPRAAKDVGAAYEAARRHPRDVEAVGQLAIVLHAWEEWESASATYRAAQELAPDDYRWWHLAGLLESRRGLHAEALPLFERAATLMPDSLPVRLRLAEARLETGDVDRSEQLFKVLAKHGQTAAAAAYGLGRIAMVRGDLETALEHLDRAVGIFPEFGAAHYARAIAYRRAGRSEEAIAALEHQQRCLPCWPATGDALAESVSAVREDAGAVLKRGVALAREGQDELATKAHERALALDPALGQARVNLIALYGRAGEWARAEAEYEQAVRLGTNLAEAHANYAQVLLARRQPDEAAALFRKALALTPGDPQAWNGLGLALETAGNTADAATAYRQASLHAPALRVARFNYARTLVAEGRIAEAIAELRQLRSPEDQETPRYLFALAAALVRAGDVEEGRAEARAALDLARRYEQSELAAIIERDLARLR